MKTPKDRTRSFDKSDELALEQAQTMYDNFIEDKTNFVSNIPMFDDPFAENFQKAITDTEAMPLDNEIRAEAEIYTEQLKGTMEEARKTYMKFIYYVKLAFPESKAMLDVFGHKQYEKERSSQTGMMNILEQAHRKAEDSRYKAAIINQGFDQTMIDQLQTVYQTIREQNRLQEDALNERKLKTQNRVNSLNTVWKFMEKISEASKIIYMDNPTKQEQYLLYPEGRYKKEEDTEEENENTDGGVEE